MQIAFWILFALEALLGVIGAFTIGALAWMLIRHSHVASDHNMGGVLAALALLWLGHPLLPLRLWQRGHPTLAFIVAGLALLASAGFAFVGARAISAAARP